MRRVLLGALAALLAGICAAFAGDPIPGWKCKDLMHNCQMFQQNYCTTLGVCARCGSTAAGWQCTPSDAEKSCTQEPNQNCGFAQVAICLPGNICGTYSYPANPQECGYEEPDCVH